MSNLRERKRERERERQGQDISEQWKSLWTIVLCCGNSFPEKPGASPGGGKGAAAPTRAQLHLPNPVQSSF